MPLQQPTVVQGDMRVTGNLSAGSISVPGSAITDANVAAGVLGNFIQASKIRQMYRPVYNQPNSAATSETRAAWTVYGATGQVLDVRAGSIVAAIGAATVTVDVKKNGTTILTAVITLNSSSTPRAAYAGTLAGAGAPNLVVGDELEIVVTATAGGGTLPTGLFVQLTILEDPF